MGIAGRKWGVIKIQYFTCPGCETLFASKEKKRTYCSRACGGRASGVTHNKPHTKETRLKLSAIRKGKPAHNKGSKVSLETRIKASCTKRNIAIDEFDGFAKSKDTLERQKFRDSIQKKVFERDDYTCQMCGDRGVALQVDHIQSWAEYVELRFDMSNCRTLCMDCHYEITYGKPKPSGIIWGHNLKHKVSV